LDPPDGLPREAESCCDGGTVVAPPPPADDDDPCDACPVAPDVPVPPPAVDATVPAPPELPAASESSGELPRSPPPCVGEDPRREATPDGFSVMVARTVRLAAGCTINGACATASWPGSSARFQIWNDTNEPATTTAPQTNQESILGIRTIIAFLGDNVHTPFGALRQSPRRS